MLHEKEDFPKKNYERRTYNRYQEEKNVPFSIKKHLEDTKIPINASELIRLAPQIKADLKEYVNNFISEEVSVNTIQESKLLYLDAKIDDQEVVAMMDIGSEATIITKRTAQNLNFHIRILEIMNLRVLEERLKSFDLYLMRRSRYNHLLEQTTS